MRALKWVVSVFVLALGLPAAAYAQASIAGTVKDTSGAVLPGVTVEAVEPGADRKDPLGGHRRDAASTASSTCGPARTP